LEKGNLFILGISSSQLTFIQRSIEELKPATSYKSNRFLFFFGMASYFLHPPVGVLFGGGQR
jgi:hypothetical protein